MIDDIADAFRIAAMKLPRMVTFVQWTEGEQHQTRIMPFLDDVEAATKWAGDHPGAVVWSVAVPADTAIHRVEQVPATYKLVQVRP